MPITEETRFITSDGKEFRVLQEAEAHEVVLSLEHALEEEFGQLMRSTNAADVADWLMEHYTLTPKEAE